MRLKKITLSIFLMTVFFVPGVAATFQKVRATNGTIPNNAYPLDELYSQISPVMSTRHHNQPTIINGHLFLAGNAIHEIWDISDPYNPVKLSEMFSPYHSGEAESHQVSFAHYPDGNGGYTLYAATTSGRGIDLWDITDATQPTLTSSMLLEGINYGDKTAAVWGIFWQGDYVYVGGTNTGLHIINAANPSNPTLVQRLPTSALGGISAGPLWAIGNLLVITTPKSSSAIVTMDISYPDSPVLLDIENPPDNSYIGGFFGAHAYLQTPFRTYDVTTDPSNITLLGSDVTPRSEYLSFGDGLLFLGTLRKSAGGLSGVLKYDISDPNNLNQLAHIEGRDDRLNDDQFSVPVGNLLVISDEEHLMGSWLAVHDTQPDTMPPQVLYMNPPDGATNQAETSRIGLSFSDQIEFTSVDETSLVVQPIGGQPISGRWGYEHTVITFWPDQPLQANTTYEVIIPAGGVTDLVGNPITQTFTSRFSTGANLNASVCQIEPLTAAQVGQTATFHAADPDPVNYTYNWDFGDGELGHGSTITHTYSNAGHYPVILTVTNNNPGQEGATVLVCAAIQIVHRPLTSDTPTHSGTVLVDETHRLVWAVNPDTDTVTAVNSRTLTKEFEVPVGRHPRTLAQAPDGSVWVVNQDSYNVSILSKTNGNLLATIELPYASQPYGVVFTPDGAVVYITLQATGQLLKLDPTARTILATLDLGPDAQGIIPKVRGIAVTSDSSRVLVTRFVSPESEGQLFDIDAASMTVQNIFALPNSPGPDTPDSGRGIPNYLSSVVISPDGVKAWLASKQDNMDRGLFHDGLTLTHDSAVRPIVSQIDLVNNQEELTARMDLNDVDMPFAAAVSSYGDLIFVAVQGSNAIDVRDAYTGEQVAGFATELAPQGLALDESGRLYVQNFMSRSLSIFDVSTILDGSDNIAPLLATIDLISNETLPADVLLGKQIFYNANTRQMNREGYISCASCHLDGASDGRVWDFSDRGEGLRNTITLLGRSGTGHGNLHWTANFDEIQDFENDIRYHFGGTGFMAESDFAATSDPLGLPKAGLNTDLDALAAYVASLTTVPPSPYRNPDGSLTADGLAGRQIFQNLNCTACHVGTNFIDNQRHDVGTIQPNSGLGIGQPLPGMGFDTPTLKGIWAEPPYLHNGQAATLYDVVNSATHGGTDVLTPNERDQLVAYLLQIDENEPGD